MTLRFAVFGNPIAHSLSPAIHHMFAQQVGISLCYEKKLIPIDSFEQHVSEFFNRGGTGLNITAPFKERAFLIAKVRTKSAKEAGAANTLWMHDKHLHADNTDGIGLLRDLEKKTTLAHQSILLLGAGGAARSVIEALLSANIASLTLTNRTFSKAKALQSSFPSILIAPLETLQNKYDIIINATSYELTNKQLDLPSSLFENQPFCYDLMYTKNGDTAFVRLAKAHHCPASDGIGMLIEQAAQSFFIWNHMMPETSAIKTLLLAA